MRIKSHMKPKLEEGGFPMMLSGFKVFKKNNPALWKESEIQ